ncbi:hypothetical protein B2_31 [Stenotrophomonas phage B2]|nr:hypothetical protein B2_31 [Stenotrophomonas phage B2]
MTDPNPVPSQDPADDGDLSSILRAWMRSYVRDNLDDMLPAVVMAYDDDSNRATVRPLVMLGTTDGQKVSRAPLSSVPVFRFGGGGFFMRFPLKPGDFGWIKANDRDVSLVFQRGGQEDWPNTERLHNFSDSMFFPDTDKGWSIDGENKDALVIQSLDGSVCVALHQGKLVFTAPEAEFNIPETTWTGNISHVGGLNRQGESTSSGSISHSGDFTLDGTKVNDHDHGGVQPGGSRTDPFGD